MAEQTLQQPESPLSPGGHHPLADTPMTAPAEQTKNGTPQEPHASGANGAGGAPRRNRNATRHGLFGAQLPVNCKYIENAIRAFRRQLESEVLADRGAIGVQDAAFIQSSCRHENGARVTGAYIYRS